MKLKYLTYVLVISFLIGLISIGTAIAPASSGYDLQKTDGLEEVCEDATFTYYITYNITDPTFLEPAPPVTGATYLILHYAGNVYIDDYLPQNVTFVSASDGGLYNASAHSVEWDLVYPESNKTVSVTVTEAGTSTGYVLVNEAEAEFSPDPGGNSFSISSVSFDPVYMWAEDRTTVVNCQNGTIPEFPTVAIPIAAILGLAFIFQRRKNE